MSTNNDSLAIGYNYRDQTDSLQKAGLTLFALGLLALFLPYLQLNTSAGSLLLWSGTGLSIAGLLLYFTRTYSKSHPGVRNNGVWLRDSTSRGTIA
ncbi:MAG: FeS-binding protein, partial [Bacteroidota bacterium]|nr:FeS-binding protein [Bacteroidota bacterium]